MLMNEGKRHAARSVNAFLTATYWHIGHYIVEFEQKGGSRAEYGGFLAQRAKYDGEEALCGLVQVVNEEIDREKEGGPEDHATGAPGSREQRGRPKPSRQQGASAVSDGA